MTLAEFMRKPLSESLDLLTLSKCQIHSDDKGNIYAVELKYTSEETKSNETTFKRSDLFGSK